MLEFSLWKRLETFTAFIKHWGTARWQTLLLLFLGIYVPLSVFGMLAVQIWQHEGGLAWDVAIMLAIHRTAQPSLDQIATTLTNFGTEWGVFPGSVLVALVLLWFRHWRSLTYFLITLLGCGAINRLEKVWLHRVRPTLWDYAPVPDFSFPSGHAMSSMVFVAALVVLMWGSRWCWLILATGGVFVVAIGWTRVYLGVHYPSDIMAGWMMAIAWAVLVSVVVKPQLTAANPQAETAIEPADVEPVPSPALEPESPQKPYESSSNSV
jgi:membrane-associated phospholipid phosphatase